MGSTVEWKDAGGEDEEGRRMGLNLMVMNSSRFDILSLLLITLG